MGTGEQGNRGMSSGPPSTRAMSPHPRHLWSSGTCSQHLSPCTSICFSTGSWVGVRGPGTWLGAPGPFPASFGNGGEETFFCSCTSASGEQVFNRAPPLGTAGAWPTPQSGVVPPAPEGQNCPRTAGQHWPYRAAGQEEPGTSTGSW